MLKGLQGSLRGPSVERYGHFLWARPCRRLSPFNGCHSIGDGAPEQGDTACWAGGAGGVAGQDRPEAATCLMTQGKVAGGGRCQAGPQSGRSLGHISTQGSAKMGVEQRLVLGMSPHHTGESGAGTLGRSCSPKCLLPGACTSPPGESHPWDRR